MKKILRLLSIFFLILFLLSMLSYLTPSGRHGLLVANARLAKTGFSLWQYFWLGMVFSCVALFSYISLTRHYRKKYNIDDTEDKN
ncbi:MAG: hypothetical protein Q4C78_06155 [Synergistaceae bacterium]|nr:hypothetical protein [Synergistaceae bacterium]